MINNETAVCSLASKLVFSCSGAPDVGEISDKAARKLTKDGIGKMFFLVGIGGKAEPIMSATKSASQIPPIDGCGMDCVKNCLQQVGFDNLKRLRITDIGMEKGESPVKDECVAKAIQEAKDLFSNE